MQNISFIWNILEDIMLERNRTARNQELMRIRNALQRNHIELIAEILLYSILRKN